MFPAIYVTSVLAGERSGSLPDVLERFISYQKVALAVRKKLIVSLIYPALLIFLVICLVVFLVTYVVPNFAELYKNLDADLPAMTLFLIALGTTARSYVVGGFIGLVVAIVGIPLLGEEHLPGRNGGPFSAEDPRGRRSVDEVSGSAVLPHAGNVADRRDSANAGAEHRRGVAGDARAERMS